MYLLEFCVQIGEPQVTILSLYSLVQCPHFALPLPILRLFSLLLFIFFLVVDRINCSLAIQKRNNRSKKKALNEPLFPLCPPLMHFAPAILLSPRSLSLRDNALPFA